MAVALECALHQGPISMNAYINEIFLGQGRRPRDPTALASPASSIRQAARGARPVGSGAAGRGGARTFVLRSAPSPPNACVCAATLVLKVMADQGIVTAREASAGTRTSRSASAAGRRRVLYPAYLDFVRSTLRRDYHDQDLTEAGLADLHSPEPRAQEHAEQALEHELTRLDRLHKHAPAPLEGAVVVNLTAKAAT